MNIKDYVSGKKVFSIPTYFIDCSEISHAIHHLYPDGKEICKNFTFLGKQGIKDIEGLKIGYLSGVMSKKFPKLYKEKVDKKISVTGAYYTQSEVDQLIS